MRLMIGEWRIPLQGVAVSVVLLLGGCAAGDESPPSPPPETVESSTVTPDFTIVDSMFSQMMIPHHKQALEMSALVPERTDNPEVLALAAAIEAAQTPEIEQMTAWLVGWGLPTEIDMELHREHVGMEGMLTEEQLAALAAASGPEFDRLWLEGMIAHHEGAVVMAETVVASGTHPPTVALAVEIIEAQETEIELMRALLDG